MDRPDLAKIAVTATLDEIGRVLIPTRVRTLVGWHPGDRLYAMPGTEHGTLYLFKADTGSLALDDWNRIVISDELRNRVGWEKDQRIELKKCAEKDCLVLTVARMYVVEAAMALLKK